MEPPIRIKLYGLMSVTRRGYLVQLGAMVVLLVVLLVIWWWLPPAAGASNLPLEVQRLLTALNALPWVVLGIAVLVTLEAYFVLRRFAREEALRRAKAPPEPPKP
jgi:hypothetical protein